MDILWQYSNAQLFVWTLSHDHSSMSFFIDYSAVQPGVIFL